jgi:hypothetical protein
MFLDAKNIGTVPFHVLGKEQCGSFLLSVVSSVVPIRGLNPMNGGGKSGNIPTDNQHGQKMNVLVVCVSG